MTRLFAVTRSRGPQWDPDPSMDWQRDWRQHADFMNGLHADGFVLLGGPLEGTSDILLVVHATIADEITARLADDCWTKNDLLRVSEIVPWSRRIGSLG
jgi:hypothetical protein